MRKKKENIYTVMADSINQMLNLKSRMRFNQLFLDEFEKNVIVWLKELREMPWDKDLSDEFIQAGEVIKEQADIYKSAKTFFMMKNNSCI